MGLKDIYKKLVGAGKKSAKKQQKKKNKTQPRSTSGKSTGTSEHRGGSNAKSNQTSNRGGSGSRSTSTSGGNRPSARAGSVGAASKGSVRPKSGSVKPAQSKSPTQKFNGTNSRSGAIGAASKGSMNRIGNTKSARGDKIANSVGYGLGYMGKSHAAKALSPIAGASRAPQIAAEKAGTGHKAGQHTPTKNERKNGAQDLVAQRRKDENAKKKAQAEAVKSGDYKSYYTATYQRDEKGNIVRDKNGNAKINVNKKGATGSNIVASQSAEAKIKEAKKKLKSSAEGDLEKGAQSFSDEKKEYDIPFYTKHKQKEAKEDARKRYYEAKTSIDKSKESSVRAYAKDFDDYIRENGWDESTVLNIGGKEVSVSEYRKQYLNDRRKELEEGSKKQLNEYKKSLNEETKNAGKVNLSGQDIYKGSVEMANEMVDYLVPYMGTTKLALKAADAAINASKIGKAGKVLTKVTEKGGRELSKSGKEFIRNEIANGIKSGKATDAILADTRKKIMSSNRFNSIGREVLANAMQDASIGTAIDLAKGVEKGYKGEELEDWMKTSAALNLALGAPVSAIAGRTGKAGKRALTAETKNEINASFSQINQMTKSEGSELLKLQEKQKVVGLSEVEGKRLGELEEKTLSNRGGIAQMDISGKIVANNNKIVKEIMSPSELNRFTTLQAKEANGTITASERVDLDKLGNKVGGAYTAVQENAVKAIQYASNPRLAKHLDLDNMDSAVNFARNAGDTKLEKQATEARITVAKEQFNTDKTTAKYIASAEERSNGSVVIRPIDEEYEQIIRETNPMFSNPNSRIPDGFTFTMNGKRIVMINPNGTRKTAVTLAHELTHGVLKADNSFINSLKKFAGDDVWKKSFKEHEEMYKNVDGANINEETGCDLMGDLMGSNRHLFAYLAGDNPSAFTKMRSYVKGFMSDPDYAKDATLKEVYNQFEEGYKAMKNPSADDVIQNAMMGDAKFALSDEYAPTFYSKMYQVVDQRLGKGKRFGTQDFERFFKKKGVKAEEVEWSGIKTFLNGRKSVTKEELLDYIQANALELKTKKRADNEGLDATQIDDFTGSADWFTDENLRRLNEKLGTKWGDYALLGGDNYREYEYILPNGKGYSNSAMRTHWGDTDVVVHSRIQDFHIGVGESMPNAELVNSSSTNIANNAKREIAEELGIDRSDPYFDGGDGFSSLEDDDLLDFHFSETYPVNDKYIVEVSYDPDVEAYWVGLFDEDIHIGTPRDSFAIRDLSDLEGNIHSMLDRNKGLFGTTQERGDSVLFVEEIQSDWHNAGASIAYQKASDSSRKAELQEADKALRKRYFDEYREPYRRGEISDEQYDVGRRAFREERDRLTDEYNRIDRAVPNAPYKKKGYTEYAMKRAFREAAENGQDYVAWTTAKQQSDRWSDEYAEGYRIEYDQDIPSFVNSYVKQFDPNAKVEKIALAENGEEVWAIKLPEKMKQSVLYEGQPSFAMPRQEVKKGLAGVGQKLRGVIDSNGTVSKEADEAYKRAVESGDTETQHKMIEEVANERFKDSKLRDSDGNLVPMYHSTISGRFNVFDKNKANPEGNSGAGFYFSSSRGDSASNYGTPEGADITYKIQKRADEIMDIVDREGEYNGRAIKDWDEARDVAEDEMYVGSEEYVTYLNTRNPVYVGKYGDNNETNMLDSLMDGYETSLHREDYDDEWEFEDALWDERADYAYNRVDDIAEDVSDVADGEDWQRVFESVRDSINECLSDGRMTYDDLKEALNRQPIHYYNEEGQDTINEIARAVSEKLGYDAIIDSKVSDKFGGMEGIKEGDFHAIVFKPEQIKEVSLATRDDSGRLISLSERFDETNPDIRYAAPKDGDFNGVKTFDPRKPRARGSAKNPVEFQKASDFDVRAPRTEERGENPVEFKNGASDFDVRKPRTNERGENPADFRDVNTFNPKQARRGASAEPPESPARFTKPGEEREASLEGIRDKRYKKEAPPEKTLDDTISEYSAAQKELSDFYKKYKGKDATKSNKYKEIQSRIDDAFKQFDEVDNAELMKAISKAEDDGVLSSPIAGSLRSRVLRNAPEPEEPKVAKGNTATKAKTQKAKVSKAKTKTPKAKEEASKAKKKEPEAKKEPTEKEIIKRVKELSKVRKKYLEDMKAVTEDKTLSDIERFKKIDDLNKDIAPTESELFDLEAQLEAMGRPFGGTKDDIAKIEGMTKEQLKSEAAGTQKHLNNAIEIYGEDAPRVKQLRDHLKEVEDAIKKEPVEPEGGYAKISEDELPKGLKKGETAEDNKKPFVFKEKKANEVTFEDFNKAVEDGRLAGISETKDQRTVVEKVLDEAGKARKAYDKAIELLIDDLHAFEALGRSIKNKAARERFLAQTNQLRVSKRMGRAYTEDIIDPLYRKHGLVGKLHAEKRDTYEKYVFLKHNADRIKKGTDIYGGIVDEAAIQGARNDINRFEVGINDLKKQIEQREKLQLPPDPYLEKGIKNYEAKIAKAEKRIEKLTNEGIERNNAILKDIEKRYPDVKDFQKSVVEFADSLNKMDLEAGIIGRTGKNGYDTLKKDYPNYVPTYRNKAYKAKDAEGKEMEELGFEDLLELSTFEEIDIAKGMRRAKGGDDDLVPLYNQLVAKANMVAKRTEQNRLAQMIADVTGDLEPHEIPSNLSLKDALEAIPKTYEKDGKHGLIYFVDGKAHTVEISESMAREMRRWSGEEKISILGYRLGSDPLTKAVSPVARTFKSAITDWNVLFGAKNFVRDQQTAWLYTKDLKGYIAAYPKVCAALMPERVARMLPKKFQPYFARYRRIYRAYMDNGGKYSPLVRTDGVKALENWRKGNPLKWASDFNAVLETFPRMQEFTASVDADVKKLVKGGMDRDEAYNKVLSDHDMMSKAMYRSKDVTLNFDRGGTIGRWLNSSLVPFFNPAIQGLSKVARFLAVDNKSATDYVKMMGFLSIGVVAPGALWELRFGEDEDYKSLTNYYKDNYYCLPVGDGKFIKIPKARELGALQNPIDHMIRHTEFGQPGDWKEMFKLGYEQIGPVSPIEDNLVAPLVRAYNNKNWFGGQIENRYDQKLIAQGKSDEVFDEKTSLLAIKLGKQKALKDRGISPKKIDNMMDSYLGVFYDMGIGQFNQSNDSNDPTSKKLLDTGKRILDTNFVVDSYISNKYAGKLYDKESELNQKIDDAEKGTQAYRDAVAAKRRFDSNYSYDNMTYQQAIADVKSMNSLSSEKKNELVRRLKCEQRQLQADSYNGKKKSDVDVYDTLLDVFKLNKTIEEYSYTSKNAQGKETNALRDAWRTYKKSDEYKKNGGKKFKQMFNELRDLNSYVGESKTNVDYDSTAFVIQHLKSKGKDTDALTKAFDVWESSQERADKYFNDMGGNLDTYKKTHKKVVEASIRLGYDYTNQIDDAEKAVALAQGDTIDRGYYAEKVDRKTNAARCVVMGHNWTDQRLSTWAASHDIDCKKCDNWSKYKNGKCSPDYVKKCIEKDSKEKTREGKAALFALYFPYEENPFGEIGDYSLDGDTGVDGGYGKGGYGRRRRRGRRGGRRGGHGGGGGGGGGATMPTTASGAIKGKVTNPFGKVSDYRITSNLDDAYRKKAKKLREANRKKLS